MPVFEEIRDAVANENFKMGTSYPSARLQSQTMDYDRQRTQMGDNSIERQNGQHMDNNIARNMLNKSFIEPDIESAGAYKEIRNGVSETSQGFHFANGGQQIAGSIANNINTLANTVDSLISRLNQTLGHIGVPPKA